MKTRSLYVDGYDVWRYFQMYVIEGGWNDLIGWPALKEVETNDWQEEDGEEADLTAPVLDTREISIKFVCVGNDSDLFGFLDLLSDGAYHDFIIPELGGRKYKLRLVEQSSLKTYRILGQVTLKFADDFPLKDYTYVAPSSSMTEDTSYQLDDVPLSTYGCRVLQGTLNEIAKSAAVKENLLRNLSTIAGASYDAENVTYQAKNVKLYLLFRADTLDELWQNYDAFLYNLTQPGERELFVEEFEMSFPCYYKEASVTKFYSEDRIWLQVTLTLVFTADFRIDTEDILLFTEDGQLVMTEDDTYAIDMAREVSALKTMRLLTSSSLRFTSAGTMRFNN